MGGQLRVAHGPLKFTMSWVLRCFSCLCKSWRYLMFSCFLIRLSQQQQWFHCFVAVTICKLYDASRQRPVYGRILCMTCCTKREDYFHQGRLAINSFSVTSLHSVIKVCMHVFGDAAFPSLNWNGPQAVYGWQSGCRNARVEVRSSSNKYTHLCVHIQTQHPPQEITSTVRWCNLAELCLCCTGLHPSW